MGLLDSFKAFVHSITTDDHYASYDSSYRNSSNNDTADPQGSLGNGSTIRLNNDLNGSQYSLDNAAGAGFYRPGMKSSQQDLPLQNLSSDGQPPLPSIDSLWDRIEYWIEQEYPELEDNLNDGVTTADLNEFIQDLQVGNSRSLPDDFREFYKRHDGQLRGGKPTGLIMGLVLLDLEAIIEEKMLWTKVAQRLETQFYMAQHQQRQQADVKEGSSSANTAGLVNNTFIANQRSIPPNSIQPYYYHKGWVVLLKDNIGNQIAMDLSPGPNGVWGQIILFGRDFDTKLVIASSLQEFIFGFVSDLEQGNFQIDSSEYQEQLGYLSNDRNGDFMIGDEDEDQGDLSYFDKDGQEFGKNVLRGRLNYIEVLKRRALKKYGLSETFETTFVPQRQPKKHHQPQPQKSNSGSNTPILSQSRNVSVSNLKKTNTNGSTNKPTFSSPLANADASSSSFTVPKETIIDGKTSATKETEDPKIESKPEEDSKDPIENEEIKLNGKEEEKKQEIAEPSEPNEEASEEVPAKQEVPEETPVKEETSEEVPVKEEKEAPAEEEEKQTEATGDESKKDKIIEGDAKEVTDGLKEVEL